MTGLRKSTYTVASRVTISFHANFPSSLISSYPSPGLVCHMYFNTHLQPLLIAPEKDT